MEARSRVGNLIFDFCSKTNKSTLRTITVRLISVRPVKNRLVLTSPNEE